VPARSDAGDLPLAMLVLVGVACALAAPVLGRSGHPGVADLAMLAAAGCGVASFALAGAATLRAARRGAGAQRRGERRP
jgi:hypothetical protein